jgi:tRNA pseudouridine38-40 synthase
MQEAAGQVLGEHDFRSFAAREPDVSARSRDGEMHIGEGQDGEPQTGKVQAVPGACVKRLLSSTWLQPEPDLLCYQVRGTGFLHHMVRNLVGTFLDVGRGQIEPGAVARILAARERSAAGSTAPARGLFLVSVEY